jgi:hypothetical protein
VIQALTPPEYFLRAFEHKVDKSQSTKTGEATATSAFTETDDETVARPKELKDYIGANVIKGVALLAEIAKRVINREHIRKHRGEGGVTFVLNAVERGLKDLCDTGEGKGRHTRLWRLAKRMERLAAGGWIYGGVWSCGCSLKGVDFRGVFGYFTFVFNP